MSKIIDAIDNEQMEKAVPEFAPGDTVIVQVKVKEGNRERLQAFDDRVEAFPVAGRLADAAVNDEVLGTLGHLGVEVVHDHAQRGFGQPALCRQLRPGRRLDSAITFHCSSFSSSTTSADVDLGVPGGV